MIYEKNFTISEKKLKLVRLFTIQEMFDQLNKPMPIEFRGKHRATHTKVAELAIVNPNGRNMILVREFEDQIIRAIPKGVKLENYKFIDFNDPEDTYYPIDLFDKKAYAHAGIHYCEKKTFEEKFKLKDVIKANQKAIDYQLEKYYEIWLGQLYYTQTTSEHLR